MREVLHCASCNMTEVQARATPKRDKNGSLLCQTCRDPYPYAEPNEDGSFHCYGCRRDKAIRAENNPKAVAVSTGSLTAASSTGTIVYFYSTTNTGAVNIKAP